ncbi:MAG: DivIVA domain-containing protein [Actinomycetota bacterium]
MRRKKAEGADASGADGRLTPVDVQQVEFRLAFRGYNERDVDAFLDRITEELTAYMEDDRRLRAGMPPLVPPPAVGDVASARTEAERIIAGARAEASRILRDAEAGAALTGAPAGNARAAVAPFLNTEREFLQSLGSLVQGHAEEVKQMVIALRAKTEAPAVAPEPVTTPEPAVAPEPAVEVEVGPEPAPATPATTAEDASAPISVPAADDATDEGTAGDDRPIAEPAPVQLRRDSGEHSLRELFWGED